MPPVAHLDEGSTASFSVGDPPKTGTSSPRSSGVIFKDEHFRIHEVESFCEEEELADNIWYTKSEYDIIKARNALLAKMKKAGKFEESEDHTFRGLEHKLKNIYQSRKNAKFDALNAVLEEQDRQYVRKKCDQDSIAKVYMEVTVKAHAIAATTGAIDAAVAQGKTPEEAEALCTQSAEDESVGSTGTVSKNDSTDDDMTMISEASQSKKKGLRRIFRLQKNRRRASM